MAYHKKQETSLRVQQPGTLMDFLLSKMGGMSRTSVKNLLARRVVRLNGGVETRPNVELQEGDQIVIVPEQGTRTLTHPKLRIVYEDD